MDDVWNKIVAEALARGITESRGAVAGAKLRQLISKVASENNAAFPPSDQPQMKFADFLKLFGDQLVFLKRQAQDLLVAPKDRPELLLETASDEQAQLRDDVFEVFTLVPRGSPPKFPWYDKLTDHFDWIPGDSTVDETAWTRVPPATREQEVQSRTEFLQRADIDQETRDALRPTLSTHSAFWAFSQGLKGRGLGKKWHKFRFQEVLKRLREWSEANAIPWRDNWIVDRKLADQESRAEVATIQSAPQQIRLADVFRDLTDSDIQRIMIPLDIVLKLQQR